MALALVEMRSGEVRAFSSYPPSLDDVPRLLEQHHDVIIIDLDSDSEYALDLVESIGASGAATVMVYSAKPDPDLLVRCMRAGAREFLTLPLELGTMAESLVRAAARKPVVRVAPISHKKTSGKLLVFMGAKGGAGVTTLACNFAVALAQEPNQKTLVDRSRSSLWGRGIESGNHLGVFNDRRPATERAAGWKLSCELAGQAQHGRFGACGSGKISAVPADRTRALTS